MRSKTSLSVRMRWDGLRSAEVGGIDQCTRYISKTRTFPIWVGFYRLFCFETDVMYIVKWGRWLLPFIEQEHGEERANDPSLLPL